MISLMGIWSTLSSRVIISTVQPVRAFPSGTLAVWIRLIPCLRKRGWDLSFTINTMSAANKNVDFVDKPKSTYMVKMFLYFARNPQILNFFSDWFLPGTLFGPWSPSSGNVIFVPGFQPFLTVIVKIFSLILDVWPSSFITC